MKHIIVWGIVLGLCAFLANILLPGCIEPFADMLAAFIAALVAVGMIRPETRGVAVRSGLLTGLVVGAIVMITDILFVGLLAAGYVYKDQLAWLKLPDLSSLNVIFGNTVLVILVVSLCLGVVKAILILLGGAAGGAIMGPSSALAHTKTD